MVTVANALPLRESVMELWTVLMAKMSQWSYVANQSKVLIASSFYVLNLEDYIFTS